MKLWIENDQGEILFGAGKTKLLEKIDELGSISKASSACNIEYKKAWQHINLIEEKIQDLIIVRKKGGKEGGGTALTPKGKELVNAYRQFQADMQTLCREKYKQYFMSGDQPIINPKGEKPHD